MSFLSKTFRYVNSLGQEIIFDYAHGYLINLPDGVDTLSVNVSQAQGIGQVGSTVQSKSIQARPITFNGKVVGDNPQRLKDALVTVVRPDLIGVLYAGNWHIDVVVTASPTIGAASKGAPFQFSLLAPYPYWVSGESKAQKLRGVHTAAIHCLAKSWAVRCSIYAGHSLYWRNGRKRRDSKYADRGVFKAGKNPCKG